MCVEDVLWSRDERYFPPDPLPSTQADDVNASERPKTMKYGKERKRRLNTLCLQWENHPITYRTERSGEHYVLYGYCAQECRFPMGEVKRQWLMCLSNA